jgi:hypothetical protein
MDSVKARRTELRSKGKDLDLLKRCNSIWRNNLDEFRQMRARGHRFYDGDQWGDMIEVNGKKMTYRQYLQATGNVVLQTNQIKNRVDTIVGIMVKEKGEPVCHAIDRDEQQLGEIVTEALQANCDKNVISELYMKWLKEMCLGGLAVAYESYDDTHGPSRRLDSWTQYINPNMVFFDGEAVDPRFWDFSIVGRFYYGSFEDICAQFVKSPGDYDVLRQIYATSADKFKSDDLESPEERFEDGSLEFAESNDPKRCFVCEVWTKETRSCIRLHDTNDGTEEIIDADDYAYRKEIKAENERRRQLAIQAGWGEEDVPYIVGDGYGKDKDERSGFFIDTYWYCRFLAPDGTILWEGESPYADRSHPFSFCIFSYIDGRIVGYCNDAIDHNVAMNRAVILHEWLVRSQAKGVTVVPRKLLGNTDPTEFSRSWTAIDELVFVDLEPGEEGLMPKQFNGVAQTFDIAGLLATYQRLMDSGSPVNGALQGDTPHAGTSGSLYAQMATNASTPVAAMMEQFRNFIVTVLNKKMKNIVKFYAPERFRSIAGQVDSVTDMANVDLNDIADLEYDLRIRESANTPVFREMQEQDLLLFLQAGFITFEEYLEASSKPYVDKILQKRQAQQAEMQDMQQGGMMPPQPQGGGGIPEKAIESAGQDARPASQLPIGVTPS